MIRLGCEASKNDRRWTPTDAAKTFKAGDAKADECRSVPARRELSHTNLEAAGRQRARILPAEGGAKRQKRRDRPNG
jgi:hypothetical protein